MKQNRPNPPSFIKIAEYWDSKGNFVNDDPDPIKCYSWNPMIDIGEPSCQACGRWNTETINKKSIYERWNASGLEKAHIVGYAVGGSNEPSNFLLLCRFCHFDFDNQVYISDMSEFSIVLEWLSKRRSKTSDIISYIVSEYIKKHNYDKSIFYDSIQYARMNTHIDPSTKSLQEYINIICINASGIYNLIKDKNNHEQNQR